MEQRLTPWRWLLATLATLFAGLPLALILLEAGLLQASALAQSDRLAVLLSNTVLLVGAVLLLAMPVGLLLGLLLFRSDLPCRGPARGLVLLAAFVPLPLILCGWQAWFGTDGILPLSFWESRAGQPWTSGLAPTIWVHAVAALPWVTLLCGMGLTLVERDAEEEGLLRAPPRRVVWSATLPRGAAVIAATALLVAALTAGEITVAYMFATPTLAQDVYAQFALGDEGALARSVFGALPWLALMACAGLGLSRRLASLPPLDSWQPNHLTFPLRAWRWPALVLAALGLGLMLAAPCAGLVLRLGRVGSESWSASEALHRLSIAWQLHGARLALMLGLALFTGFLTASLGLVAAWSMHGSRRLTAFLAAIALLLVALPAPVIGIGLKKAILWIAGWAPTDLFAEWLYHRGPAAIIWAQTLRFWPFALALFWAMLRLLPREPIEAARLEGRGAAWELANVVLPATLPAFTLTGMLTTALALAEVAASSRAETPGWETFARLLFDRMHYGVDGEVAALGLVMLGGIVLLVLAWRGMAWALRRGNARPDQR